MTEAGHLAQCRAEPERSENVSNPSKRGAEGPGQPRAAQGLVLLKCDTAPPPSLQFTRLPETFPGRAANPGKMVGQAEAPWYPPLLPHWSPRATKRSDFFTCLSSWPGQPTLWLPGGRTHPSRKQGVGREWQPCRWPPPAGRQAGDALALAGFSSLCPWTCLTGLVWVADPEKKCFHTK